MSKLIAIDNGHGLKTAGKRTPKMPNGNVIHEWEFNHPTAKKFEQAMKRCGFRTLMVSDTSNDTALRTRTDKANSAKADAFVSFHYNALNGKWGSHGGLEVLYQTVSTRAKKLATIVQRELIRVTGLRNRGAKPRSDLHVLNATKMVAILPECGFMDNLAEANLMLDISYQTKCAEAVAKGVCEYFGIKYVKPNGSVVEPTSKPNNPTSNIWYGKGSPHNKKQDITKLQQDLISLGMKLTVDGIFGTETENNISTFQGRNGLKRDGQAGQATLNKIAQLIAEKNKPKPAPTILYRVRKSWVDAKSQKGAYASLDNAVSLAKKNKGYNVYDDKGKQVYPEDVKPNPNTSNLYRVRSTWKEEDTQKGAYSNLNNAIEECKKYKGYHVYDNKGIQVYPEINTKPIEKPKPEIKPEPNSPTNNDISISGKSIATARQMEKALLSKNKSPKIKISALKFCEIFLEEGEVEGIRGDIAFCQAMKETGWLSYGGQVLPEQHNFAGIGATNNSAVGKGNWFDTERLGIRAQIQHLKAYGNKEPLVNENIDPRFRFVTRGIAPNWIDLNGRWAVPGTTYGQDIVKMYIELIEITIKEDEFVVDKSSEYLKEIKELKEELAKAYATIEKIKNIVVNK